MLTLFLIAIVLPILFYFYSKRENTNLPPRPWNFPILGCLPLLDPQKPYLSLTKLSQKYGPIFMVKFGIMNTVVISDGKLLKKVLMKDEALGRPPLFLLEYVCRGKGLTYVSEDLWKDQRKFVSNFLRSVTKIDSKRKILETQLNYYIDEFLSEIGDEVKFDPLPAIVVT